MTESVVLAVDLGTSSMKVALITVKGKVVGWESEPIKLTITPDGGSEQSPDEWWKAFMAASRRLMKRKLVKSSAIRSVCCSTQGEGTVPVDKDGKALMNCILWMDMRGAPYLRKQFHGLINLDGIDLFKILRWVRLTGGMPSPTGKDPAAHMLLVRDRFPDVYARTYKFLNVLDFLNLRLTGRFAATYDSILTSWVTNQRNPISIHYDSSLVHDCGIDPAKLPEIVSCTSVLGKLKKRSLRLLDFQQMFKWWQAPSIILLQPSAPALWRIMLRIFILALLRGWLPMYPIKKPISVPPWLLYHVPSPAVIC